MIAPEVSFSSSLLRPRIRLAFVPQLEAAPLIVARELGYFHDESLDVQLLRHVTWSAVRDGLTFGQLDAAQALSSFPLISHLGRDWFAEPLVSILSLGLGGGVIVLSRELVEEGSATSASELARWILVHRQTAPLMLSHTFSCSPHRYILRDFLASAGIHPDRDVRLSTLAPPLLVDHLARGYISGFCAGEPLGTLAEQSGAGRIIAHTHEILPDHPNQSLVLTRRWHDNHTELTIPLARAVLRAGQWCDDPANRPQLAAMLSRYEHLNLDADLISASLASAGHTFSPAAMCPSKTHIAWLVGQMIRWGEVSPAADIMALTDPCCDLAPYRAAAHSLQLETNDDDYPPMPLGRGLHLTRDQLCAPAQRAAM